MLMHIYFGEYIYIFTSILKSNPYYLQVHVSVWVCAHECRFLGSAKEWDPLDLELQVIVRNLTQMPNTKT